MAGILKEQDEPEATPDQQEWDEEKSEWDPSDNDSEWKPAKDEEGWDPSDEDEWLAEELESWHDDPEMVKQASLAKKTKGRDKAEKEKKARAQAGKATRDDLGYDPDYWEELGRLA